MSGPYLIIRLSPSDLHSILAGTPSVHTQNAARVALRWFESQEPECQHCDEHGLFQMEDDFVACPHCGGKVKPWAR